MKVKINLYFQLRSGSTHGSELAYVFGIPVCNVWRHVLYQFTKSEIALSKAMMTMWTNFAKSG
jgi:carboxylesterase type B